MDLLRSDAETIIHMVISAVQPDQAVRKALQEKKFTGPVRVVAIGKAAWQMAQTAQEVLGSQICAGVVITKYAHSRGKIPGFSIFEAGHPVPDENGQRGTDAAISLVKGLTSEETVLFLVSGGGSALFEKSRVPLEEMQDITHQLLASGADITEINTIRKRLSYVKGGRFARLCQPARIYSIVLSDVLGDPLDVIASGPAFPDSSTQEDARKIAEKYHLRISEQARLALQSEPVSALDNVETVIAGGVSQLCAAAAEACRTLGYQTTVLTDRLSCEAKEAGSFLAAIARYYADSKEPLAFIAGGETVVHLTGNGMGGRNQEIALSAAEGIAGLSKTAIFSVGSDGTDGPTDAAGGYVDGNTRAALAAQGLQICDVLHNNDAYHALLKCGGLIITGPTGTNVNDVSIILIKTP